MRLSVVLLFSLFSYALLAKAEMVMPDRQTKSSFIQNQNYPFQLIKFSKLSLEKNKETQYINNRSNTAIQPMQAWGRAPLPSSISLGMSNVPVLNHGEMGEADTFAATALLDAIYGHGDYISQICYLQIDSGSGWHHEHEDILDDLKKDGIISKEYEHTNGCAGLYNYPNNFKEVLDAIFSRPFSRSTFSASDYTQHSEKIFSNLITHTRNAFDITVNFYDLYYGHGSALLLETKNALAKGHRLLFGFYILRKLDDENVSHGKGLYAHYHASQNTNDSWVLSSEINSLIEKAGDCGYPYEYLNCDADTAKDLQDNAHISVYGNSAVITGYDDNAVIIDEHGVSHQGILSLRDSQGVDVGDQGNFYMSYDYFKKQGVKIEEAYLP